MANVNGGEILTEDGNFIMLENNNGFLITELFVAPASGFITGTIMNTIINTIQNTVQPDVS